MQVIEYHHAAIEIDPQWSWEQAGLKERSKAAQELQNTIWWGNRKLNVTNFNEYTDKINFLHWLAGLNIITTSISSL